MLPSNKLTCLQAAVKMLADRALSERNLRRRLAQKGYPGDDIDTAIAKLHQRGYLDDAALCRMLFTRYTEGGKYGSKAIVVRLKEQGLADATIRETMQDYNYDAEYERALTLAHSRFSQLSADNAAKAGRFLAGRGFSFTTIHKVLDQLCDTHSD